jgi:hypothetical protein
MHYASIPEPRVRLLVLDAMSCGVAALSTCEAELLPVAHDLWKPLVREWSSAFGDDCVCI